MDTNTKPIPASAEQLQKLASSLPQGATIIGALHAHESTHYSGGDCFLVIYAADDHTIHKATMCQTGPDSYEIPQDVVVGTW